MSVAIRRVQVDDEGHAVGVDIALVRSPGAPHLVHADGIPPDVRTALQAWLLPEGHVIVAPRAQVPVHEDEREVERLCEVMHDAYERAATQAGWETQARSRVPWDMVPEANRVTMRAAVRALLGAL